MKLVDGVHMTREQHTASDVGHWFRNKSFRNGLLIVLLKILSGGEGNIFLPVLLRNPV